MKQEIEEEKRLIRLYTQQSEQLEDELSELNNKMNYEELEQKRRYSKISSQGCWPRDAEQDT